MNCRTLTKLLKKSIDEIDLGESILIKNIDISHIDKNERNEFDLVDFNFATSRWISGSVTSHLICSSVSIRFNVKNIKMLIGKYVPFYNKNKVSKKLIKSLVCLIGDLGTQKYLDDFANVSNILCDKHDVSAGKVDYAKYLYEKLINDIMNDSSPMDAAVNELLRKSMYTLVNLDYEMSEDKLSQFMKIGFVGGDVDEDRKAEDE